MASTTLPGSLAETPPSHPTIVYVRNPADSRNAWSDGYDRLHGTGRPGRLPFTIQRQLDRDYRSDCRLCRGSSLISQVSERCLHPTKEEMRLWTIECEEAFYQMLILDGVPPLYCIALLEDVSRDPSKYVNMISYFQHDDPHCFTIFRNQWERWRSFRTWQIQMRKGHKEKPDSYPNYCHERLQALQYPGRITIKQNPRDMDRFNTWLEYSCYEYTRYENFSWYRDLNIRFDMYDRFWQMLMWEGVLRPSDDRSELETAVFKTARASWKQQAKAMHEHAHGQFEIAQNDELDPANQGDQEQKAAKIEARRRAQSRVEDTQDHLDKVTRWDEAIERFCCQTIEYRIGRREGIKQEYYLNWIRSQFPIICNQPQPLLETPSRTGCEVVIVPTGTDGRLAVTVRQIPRRQQQRQQLPPPPVQPSRDQPVSSRTRMRTRSGGVIKRNTTARTERRVAETRSQRLRAARVRAEQRVAETRCQRLRAKRA